LEARWDSFREAYQAEVKESQMSDFHMPVELLSFEISMSIDLAESRRKANREAGIVDRMIGFRDPLEIEIDGVLGEFAVCKYLNVFPDLTTEIRAGGHDCVYMLSLIHI
jgi:hypothetical protein